jgi:hypothetical protein
VGAQRSRVFAGPDIRRKAAKATAGGPAAQLPGSSRGLDARGLREPVHLDVQVGEQVSEQVKTSTNRDRVRIVVSTSTQIDFKATPWNFQAFLFPRVPVVLFLSDGADLAPVRRGNDSLGQKQVML